MKKIIPHLILCLLVQGCVGGAVLKSRTTTIQDPVIPDKREYWPRQRASFDPTNTVIYSAVWLESHWGKPASISRSDADHTKEIWTYKNGLIWEGVEAIIAIPIPIALPVKREKIHFELRDGRVVSAVRVESRMVGGAFGYCMGPCGISYAGAFGIDE